MSLKTKIKKILVVDDDEGICTMLTQFLRSSGYDCESTTDPIFALEILRRNNFEIIISDIKMPGMDGLQLLDETSRIDPGLDTIMMTGHTDTYTYSDIIKAGASDFILKPFQTSELKAKLERIDRERKMLKGLQDLNTALGVLLQRGEAEREELSAEVVSNVKELISPYLDKLKNSRLDAEQKQHLEIVESGLCGICSQFMKNLSLQHAHISSMEVQVANLIKVGKKNKEIASILGVSLNTVMTHRYHLRSKLGLKQEKINLRSHLISIEF
ncbi:MAG: response regulator [Syntrophobacteraceae bacterium]